MNSCGHLSERWRRTAGNLLAGLVRLDSRNTASLRDGEVCSPAEEAVCRYLARQAEESGLRSRITYPAPGRPSIFIESPAAPAEPVLVFEAHMDTVGTDGMTIAPFSADIRNGRLFGRGATDDKGSLAAMFTALLIAHEQRFPLRLVLAATCAEENGCEGAPLLDFSDLEGASFVVGEPTGNTIVTAHKSHVEATLTTRGRAGHASRGSPADNAVLAMARVIVYIQDNWVPALSRQSAGGLTTSNAAVTVIRGGTRVNVLPDTCTAGIDLRLVPGIAPESLVGNIVDGARKDLGVDLSAGNLNVAPALMTPPNCPLVRTLRDVLREHGLNAGLHSVDFCTNAGVFAQRGFPSLVFGPGDISQAHSADEYLELRELYKAVEILGETAYSVAEHTTAG